MKSRSVIIDDNAFMATVLMDMLSEHHPEIEVLGVAYNGEEGMGLIKKIKPNLVFLDIEMPDMTGFEMLRRLGSIAFQTIFTTAHSHYAIKAIRFNALDYLVKPIVHQELYDAIKRFNKEKRSFNNQEKIQNALLNLKVDKVEDQRLLLQTQKGSLRIALKRIVKIEGDRNYSLIYLSDGSTELSSKTLGYFEEILFEKGFFRCHRSYLVNRMHIESIIDQGSFLLKNRKKVPISRRKMNEAKHWFHS